jgi:hypothetical protein
MVWFKKNPDLSNNPLYLEPRITAAETSLAQIATNIKNFGAIGDGTSHKLSERFPTLVLAQMKYPFATSLDNEIDRCAIQAAVNSISSVGGRVYSPIGRYRIDDTILVDDRITLFGEDKYNTIDDNGTLLTKPLIANRNYGTAFSNKDISIMNMSVYSQGERTVWTVCLQNTNNAILGNAYICENNGTSSPTSKHGYAVIRANGYSGSMFVTRATNNRFSAATLVVNGTDSYVVKNELWGNTREAALDLTLSSNTMVSLNQIVGGQVYGGIIVRNDTSGLKIIGNYFDGSYWSIDTKWSIYSLGLLDRCIIQGNNFWNQKAGGIYTKSAQLCDITGNIFDECDKWGDGYSDIKFDPTGSSWGNKIGNTHKRQYAYSKTDGTTVTRSTVSPPPVLDLQQLAGYAPNIISGNNLSYSQYYSASKFNGGDYKLGTNGHSHFIDPTNKTSIVRTAKQTFVFSVNGLTANANIDKADFAGSNQKKLMLGQSGIVKAMGISMGTARTAGSITVTLMKNGSSTGNSITFNGQSGNNYTYLYTWANGTEYAFGAQDTFSLNVTSSSDFAPTPNDIEISLVVQYD